MCPSGSAVKQAQGCVRCVRLRGIYFKQLAHVLVGLANLGPTGQHSQPNPRQGSVFSLEEEFLLQETSVFVPKPSADEMRPTHIGEGDPFP